MGLRRSVVCIEYHCFTCAHKYELILYMCICPCAEWSVSSIVAARQSSCSLAGVEPIHWKPVHIDPSSLIVVQIQNNVEFEE